MCDPVSLTAAGLAISVAASGASYVAQQQQASAATDAQNQYNQQSAAATNAATQKQEEINQAKQATMNQSYNNYSQEQQQAQRSAQQQDLGNFYGQSVNNLAPVAVPGSQNLTGDQNSAGVLAVQDSNQTGLNSLSSYLKQQAQAKAALDSFGNQTLNNNLYNVRQGQQLANQNNFAAGNGLTQQVQQNAANQEYNNNITSAKLAGSGLSALAGIGSGLGSAIGGLSTAGAATQSIPKAQAVPK